MLPVVLLGEGYAGATMMAVVRSLGRHDVRVTVFSSHPHSPARYSRYCRYFRAPDAVREPDALQKLLIEHAKVTASPGTSVSDWGRGSYVRKRSRGGVEPLLSVQYC